MWQEIVAMFSNAGIISAICLAVGIIFCIAEFFIPGFGVFGILGLVLLSFSIVYQIIIGATITQIFLLLGIVILIVAILVILAVRSAKNGLLSKTPLVEKSTSLPVDFAENKKNYAFLMGKTGITTSVCKPVGRVDINGNTYQVISNGKYLPKGEKIEVIEVDGATIFVKSKEKEDKNV